MQKVALCYRIYCAPRIQGPLLSLLNITRVNHPRQKIPGTIFSRNEWSLSLLGLAHYPRTIYSFAPVFDFPITSRLASLGRLELVPGLDLASQTNPRNASGPQLSKSSERPEYYMCFLHKTTSKHNRRIVHSC